MGWVLCLICVRFLPSDMHMPLELWIFQSLHSYNFLALIRSAVAHHRLTHLVEDHLCEPGIAMQNQAMRIHHLQHSSHRPSVPTVHHARAQ